MVVDQTCQIVTAGDMVDLVRADILLQLTHMSQSTNQMVDLHIEITETTIEDEMTVMVDAPMIGWTMEAMAAMAEQEQEVGAHLVTSTGTGIGTHKTGAMATEGRGLIIYSMNPARIDLVRGRIGL